MGNSTAPSINQMKIANIGINHQFLNVQLLGLAVVVLYYVGKQWWHCDRHLDSSVHLLVLLTHH